MPVKRLMDKNEDATKMGGTKFIMMQVLIVIVYSRLQPPIVMIIDIRLYYGSNSQIW